MTIYDDPSMVYAMQQIKKLKTIGERRRWLDDYFGVDDSSRDAVHCLRCSDTGYAMIYHPAVVIAAAQDNKLPEWHREIAIRCNCEAGDGIPSQTRDQAARSAKNMDNPDYVHERVPVFGDSKWHIAVVDSDGRAKCSNFELRSIHEWQP